LTAVSATEKRFAQNLFNILDFAPKAANRTLAIVEGNIGEHSGSKFRERGDGNGVLRREPVPFHPQ